MAELTVPRVNFSALGELGEVYDRSKEKASWDGLSLAALGQDGKFDYDKAGAHMMKAGNPKGALQIYQTAKAQSNADRSYSLQERQLEASERERAAARALQNQQFEFQKLIANRPDIKIIKDANGNETPMLIDRQGNATPIHTGTLGTPSNPYAAGGKLNESQGKAATYSDRMAGSHDIITSLEGINESRAGLAGGVLQNIMNDDAFNMIASPDRQRYVQAQRDFVNAVLRRESGAVINPSEFDNAARQYFPQPGDSQEVIAQKRQNRITAMQGIMREAGPNYKPTGFSTGPASSERIDMSKSSANPNDPLGIR